MALEHGTHALAGSGYPIGFLSISPYVSIYQLQHAKLHTATAPSRGKPEVTYTTGMLATQRQLNTFLQN